MATETISSPDDAAEDPATETDATDPHLGVLQSMAALHARVEREVNPHQRHIETVTALLGRPSFLYITLTIVTLWILINLLAPLVHLPRWDEPPFAYLQGIISLAALLMTTMVLITQNRQAHNNERRSQLELQVGLLSEQKITKLISLVEELRRDMPHVVDRVDAEADAMTQSTDPEIALIALDYILGDNKPELDELEGD